jgi:uncharacterized protein (TIGR00251 family)
LNAAAGGRLRLCAARKIRQWRIERPVGIVQQSDTGLLLQVRVQPRASLARVEGVQGERLRLRVAAPPLEGAANAACIALLAKVLGIRRSQVHLHAGQKSRDKLFHIAGLTAAEVKAILGIT